MKTLYFKILLILTVILAPLVGCSNSNDQNQIPQPIVEFCSEYYPLQSVENFGFNGTVYHIRLENGAGLSFNSSYNWIAVNGYGEVLPEMFLFDNLPPTMYQYLQEMSLTGSVYAVTRDKSMYNVSLSDSSVTYDIATGHITTDSPNLLSTIAELSLL